MQQIGDISTLLMPTPMKGVGQLWSVTDRNIHIVSRSEFQNYASAFFFNSEQNLGNALNQVKTKVYAQLFCDHGLCFNREKTFKG